MKEIWNLTAIELRDAIRKGEITSRQATEAVLQRIERLNPRLNAYISVWAEEALAQASEIDKLSASGRPPGPLAGVPVSVKDNITTTVGTTTCGSNMLRSYHAQYDATIVKALKEAGAVIVGKTNMDEFAMGSTTETSAFGPTCNPWDTERVPGGSSGGAACAVAARLCFGAYGSDTGGSIRQPAGFCGVVGMKPTYGRVSRYGLVAFGSSLDQIGPIARSVQDCALLLEVVAGPDARDSTSAPDPVPPYSSRLSELPAELTIGVPKRFLAEGCQQSVLSVIDQVLEVYRQLGVRVVDIELPLISYSIACYYIVAPAEASSNLARYDGVHYGHRTSEKEPRGENPTVFLYSKSRQEGFGPEVKRRIMIGTHALSSGYYDAYYLKALKVRRLIKEDFDEAFKKCNLILLPTSPTPAFRLGEKITDPLAMYLSDIYTVSANLAGIPALALPGGFVSGLPVGFQLLGPPLSEELLFQAGFAFQKQTDWHTRVPAIAEERS